MRLAANVHKFMCCFSPTSMNQWLSSCLFKKPATKYRLSHPRYADKGRTANVGRNQEAAITGVTGREGRKKLYPWATESCSRTILSNNSGTP
ncbi:hypothetical protein IWW34DRAFT_862903 [Fusarium oxysporum f. sp. albedinis]|nr:hypothetical protein IWW34DRAFT_862903 [Fusarium oxysporum f. sp. albedinis]